MNLFIESIRNFVYYVVSVIYNLIYITTKQDIYDKRNLDIRLITSLVVCKRYMIFIVCCAAIDNWDTSDNLKSLR